MKLKDYCLPKVKHFRDCVGLGQNLPSLHRALFDEENEEFYDATCDSEVADALADMIFIWCGALLDLKKPIYRTDEWLWTYVQDQAEIVGIDLRGAFDLVYESNMSKLCTINDIAPTIAKYEALGVTVDFRQISNDLFAVYSDCDHVDYPRGKLLKPVSFKEPDWSREDVWRS